MAAEAAAVPGPDLTAAVRARSLVQLARPRQWLKNLLVLIAPVAAGLPFAQVPFGRIGLGFLAFCAASSAGYFVNDARDVAADRRHPVKRHRPVAAGTVTPSVATGIGAALAVGALALAALTGEPGFLVCVAVYLVLTAAYSLGLKHVEIVDVMLVASGFLLRAVAGAEVADVPASGWLILTTSFAALFVATAKRYGEWTRLGDGSLHEGRAALVGYTGPFLRMVVFTTLAVSIVCYCLWAQEKALLDADRRLEVLLTVVPVTHALLRYALLVERGAGEAPEELFLRDRGLQLSAVAWLALFVLATRG
jgi:decaprenyl-phosphate phosphoribosyltransferase